LEIYLCWRRCFGASGFCAPVILILRQKELRGFAELQTVNAENIKGDNAMKQKSIYKIKWQVWEEMRQVRTDGCSGGMYLCTCDTVTTARHIVKVHNASLKAKE